jgi:hypothetical protein
MSSVTASGAPISIFLQLCLLQPPEYCLFDLGAGRERERKREREREREKKSLVSDFQTVFIFKHTCRRHHNFSTFLFVLSRIASLGENWTVLQKVQKGIQIRTTRHKFYFSGGVFLGVEFTKLNQQLRQRSDEAVRYCSEKVSIIFSDISSLTEY